MTTAASTPAARPGSGIEPGQRVAALDALRGFDMFWILGAGALGSALRGLHGGPLVRLAANQLSHAPWEGFRFFDLIFPLFVFIMGVALTFSLERAVAAEGRGPALLRVVRRALLLYLLGLFYYGGLATPVADIRWMGVLQRLAICYLGTSLLFLNLKPRGMIVTCAALLLVYWALLTFVPVPGVGVAGFGERTNLANWVDEVFLPGRKLYGTYDPEGLLSTLPSIASCLLGVFAGLVLRDPRLTERRKAVWLAAGGVALLAAGYAWGLQFPIIKKLWTSSYALVAGGWSALLLAAFYLVVDVWKIRAWARPFLWIGANALTIYLISNIVDFRRLARRLGGGDVSAWMDAHWTGSGSLWEVLIGMVLCIAVCRFLYRRKIFLRL
jgi:predicted acyltransferase